MKTFTNARVFTGEHWLKNATVAVAQHQIQTVAENRPLETGTTVVDLQGLCLAPALIDLQIYGGKGHLFNNEPTPECLQKTYEAVLEGGGAPSHGAEGEGRRRDASNSNAHRLPDCERLARS